MTTSPVAATSNNTVLNNYLTQQAQTQAAAAAAATAASGGSTATNGIGSNLNTFLNILTTQLKNQDPTSATDPNQFTQELVQFAQVEQQLNTNSDLTKLINLQKGTSGVNASLGYIGQYVEAPSTGQLSLQNGTSEIGYNLPANVSNVAITVTNANGQTVNTFNGSTNAGLNYMSWNGQDSNGNQLSDGAYSFTVAATDTSGNAVTLSDIRTIGKVTSVQSNSDGTTNVTIGNNVSIATSTIDAVYQSGTLPSSTAI